MHLLKLPIHATPGARRTEAAGAHGQALRVRLAAPPVDGKANAALIAWAAAALGVPRSQVELLHGASGRQKVLGVRFDDAAALAAAQAQIAQWLAGGADGQSGGY
ncbi:DUF167 domain-containing protein [Ottowia sp.]|uniref:DUF167 domain-containing protein n=1 Tax=Ottowia sp. TaxID=1898956 RepID=UPI002C399884|nr:DUF167 domain-containing protein [Ottowia sp.]HNR84892.1 DUF167 domain-containing protein [Ottowia sp.]HNT84211.1 DUF167 domain-containing protein [Ottowia sp.]